MKNKFVLRQPMSGWRTGCLATASAVALAVLGGCGDSSGISSSSSSIPNIIEAFISTQATQVGGATQAVALYNDGTTDWTLYSMANRFAVAPVNTTAKVAVAEITLPGYIQHITVVTGYEGKNYALVSMGSKGIAVLDITNAAAPAYLHTMTVNYDTPTYTYSDGGGTLFTEDAATGHKGGPVNDVLVDNKGTASDTTDDELFIANTAYGIQKTKLSNLIGAGADGVLPIDGAQTWTLKYSGENPNGGPLSLKLSGGKLYAALGFLGIGIYDPADLARVGAYNKYADCTPNVAGRGAQEDWFGKPNLKPNCNSALLATSADLKVPNGDPFIDTDGMPTYNQAAAELSNKKDLTSGFPWAQFDRYGKYYYNARAMDVQVIGGKTMAFIAYSLGGLVAVDVTNPAAPTYVGYVPAAPAHGPDEPPINIDKKGILSHFGSGMLKEAGVMDIRVVPDATGTGYKAYYTDHFAGLVVVSGAEDPATKWKNPSAPYNNDKIDGAAEPRVFWPDYEFVTSYDMTPVVVGDESMPAFLVANSTGNYTAPMLLATGELNGHGGALFLMPCMATASCAVGQVDAVQSSGAGGVSYVEFLKLTEPNIQPASRFSVPVTLVSTKEVGANEDGSAGQTIAIGHAEGATVAGNFLYLADGPHGVSAWRIADGLNAIDDLHLVGNTLQSEYPTGTVMPAPHAFKVGFGSDPAKAYVMSQSLGMRRVDVSAVTSGLAKVGSPALLDAAGGLYEHGRKDGQKVGPSEVIGQDHAYGVAFSGKYAIVADGDNGLTVYDTTVSPATSLSYVAANIGDSEGAGTKSKPPLGRAASVKLWKDAATNKTYAVVAAGSYGISVVDMTAFLASGQKSDLLIDKLIKTFEPVKSDADNAFGSADGKSVDVHVVGDIAYFSYDSYGLVAYRMADLIRPAKDERPAINSTPEVCATVTDVTKLSAKQGGVGECRPTAAGYYKLQKDTSDASYADLDGGALYMTPQYFPANTPFKDYTGAVVTLAKPKLLFYVAYGNAGVVKLDWSNVATPSLMSIKGVVGEAATTAINNGRVYVAAGGGGLVVLK